MWLWKWWVNLIFRRLKIFFKLILDKCQPQQLCEFEDDDLCGYKNDETADMPWSKISGESVSFENLLIFDHTYQSPDGNYMAIENTNNNGKKYLFILI